jgi:hypothetical protein
LSINVETNLLSLVSPWLDKFYQITTKSATKTLHQLLHHLNTTILLHIQVLHTAGNNKIKSAHLARQERPPSLSVLFFFNTKLIHDHIHIWSYESWMNCRSKIYSARQSVGIYRGIILSTIYRRAQRHIVLNPMSIDHVVHIPYERDRKYLFSL